MRKVFFFILSLLVSVVTLAAETIWYDRLTNIDDLKNGDQVMISAYYKNVLMSKTMGSSKSGNWLEEYTSDLQYSEERTQCAEVSNLVYTVVKGTNYWELKADDSKCLTITGQPRVSLASSSTNSHLSLTVTSDGKTVIRNAGNSSYGQLMYNSSAKRFTTYKSGQDEVALYVRHDDEASTLTWSPESLSFPNKRLRNGVAADTLELAINFTHMNADGVLFDTINNTNPLIEFSIVGEDINIETPGTIKVCYYALEAGEGSAEINLVATAANGQEWDVKVPVSVTVLEEAAEVQAMTIAEVLTAITKENNIGNWGNGTTGTSTKEYLLGEVTVTSHVGQWIYVQDATGSLCIYDKESRTHAAGVYYQNGDVLSGIRGKVNVRKNAIDLQPGEDYDVVKVRSVAAIAPTVITEVQGVTRTDANVNKYVKIEAATVTSEGKIKLGDRLIAVVDRLGVSLSACDTKVGHYDIEGYVHADGSAMQLVVSKVSEHELKAVSSISFSESTYDMAVNGTLQLAVTILPQDASDKRLTWTSSHPDTISVDAKGLLTAHRYCETPVTITVTAMDGSHASATCAVTATTVHGARYSKVYDATTLHMGDTVILVNEAAGKANGTFEMTTSTKRTYLTAVDAIVFRDSVVAPDALGFRLSKSGGYWTLTATDGTVLGKKESTTNSADMSTKGILTHTIEIGEGGAAKVINTANDSKHYIGYNLSSFRYYSAASVVADVCLYRKIAGSDPKMTIAPEKINFDKKALDEGVATDSKTITVTASDLAQSSITVSLKHATVFAVTPTTLPISGGTVTVSYSADKDGEYADTVVFTAQTLYDGELVCECPLSVTIDPEAPKGKSATYGLLQNPADLSEGDKVFFGTHAKDFVMGVYESKDNIHAVEATYDAEKHTVTANDLNAYTVHVTQDGKYQFVDYLGRYLVNYEGGTKLSSTEDGANQYTKWTITIGEKTDEALVCAKLPIYFNKTATTPLFKCYSGVDNNVAPIFLYSDHAPEYKPYVPNPQLTITIGTEVLGDTLDWGEVVYDDGFGTDAAPYSESRSINIEGEDLGENITITVIGTGFSTLKESITPKADGSVKNNFSINFETKSEGTYSGTLTITCGSITKTVTLTAKAVKEATPDPETVTELTVSTYRVYLNPYFSNEQGVEDMEVFYVSAKNLKKNLYCKWENTEGYSIPTGGAGEMTVTLGDFGEVEYGSSLTLGSEDIDSLEVTVYVNAYMPASYYSQLYFYTYEEDKVTIAAEYRVDLAVEMSTDWTPDPDPTHDPNTDQATAIDSAVIIGMEGVRYNLLGQPVDETYRGVVILNGQKRVQ